MSAEDLILSFKGQVADALRGINDLQKNIRVMEKDLAGVGKKADDTAARMVAGMKKAGDVMVGASRRIEGAFRAMGGQMLAMFGAGGILYTMKRSIDSVNQFKTALAEVNTLLSGDGSATIEKYRRGIEKLSTRTGKSVVELTKGAYQIVSAGTKGSETVEGTMQLLEVANKAAIAGLSDTFSAVDVLTTALNSYNVGVEQAGKYSDVLFTTVKLGKINFPQLAQGLGQVVAMAANAGVKFEEVGASIAALTKGGIVPAQAFTSLQAVIRSLVNPTKDMVALFKKMGYASVEQALRQKGLVGVMEAINKATKGNTFALRAYIKETEAVRGASVLAGLGLESFKDAAAEMGKSAGATDEAYGKMADTFEEKSKRFYAALDSIYRRIGERLLPILSDKMDQIGKWFDENAEDIVDFFGRALDAIVSVGEWVIENGSAVATTLGSIWAAGKVVEWTSAVYAAIPALTAVGGAFKAIGGWLAGFPALVGKATAALVSMSSVLLPVSAALASVGVTLFALGKNKQAFAEGAAIGKASGDVYKNIRASTLAKTEPLSTETRRGIGLEGPLYDWYLQQGMAQFAAERGGAKPTLMQAQKIRAAVEQGLKDALESGETRDSLSRFAAGMGEEVTWQLNSEAVTGPAKDAFKAAAADGTAAGLEDPKVAAARARAAAALKKAYADALRLLEGLRTADVMRGLDDIGKAEQAHYRAINQIVAQRFERWEDQQEALELAETAFQGELDDIYKKRFDEGMKRDEEIANKRKKYEEEIAKITDKAADDYHRQQEQWQEEMRRKYPQAYAEFEVARGRGDASAAPGSQAMFGMGDALQDFMSQAKDWITGMLKQLGDAVADVGMDFAGVFLDLFKTPMAQLKQLLGQAIDLAAEGKQYLILTNREKAEAEARIGRPLTDAEMRQMASVVSPSEKAAMEREGRLGEYTVVGERTPEQAANSVLDKFIAFWENLADNLDGILKWIESTAFPRLINAIVKALPKIIAAIISFVKATATSLAKDWLQKILDVIFDLIPKLIKGVMDSIKSFLHNLDIERLINSIINFIIDLIITIVKDIIDLIANVIPDLISKINHAIPGIVANLVKAIVMELIPEIVLALVDAIKTIFTGDNITGSKTWDGILTLVTGGISGTVGKYLHEGGMISRDLLGSTRALEGAVRAHQGTFVGAGGFLRSDEVPIIAQVGEAVLNRQAVANLGGAGGINRINAGEVPGGGGAGGVTVVNQISVAHMLSRDTEQVIDEMQGDALKRRAGKVHQQMTRGRVLGFVPRSG